MTTFADLVEHVLAYAGKDASRASNADYRRAVLNAYRVLPTRHEWLYFLGLGRVTTAAPYSTGTVAYDATGGTYERMVTLTSGTWPSWAAGGVLLIANIPYEVEAKKSSTVLTLTAQADPGSDIAAGTSYTLVRDTYPLPADFLTADEVVASDIGATLNFEHARIWVAGRRSGVGPSRPTVFTVTGDPETTGGMALRLWPAPDQAYPIDLAYRRRPRAMVFDQVTDGLVGVTANSTTVTGTNTRFAAAHVGSVIRVAADNQTLPTGPEGTNPYVQERTIASYTSATSVEVSSAFDTTCSSVRYAVSDPVDVEPTMLEFLQREVEKQFRIVSRMNLGSERSEAPEYEAALVRAREADSRYTGRRASLRRQDRRFGLRDYPITLP